MTASTGSWTSGPTSYTYAWRDCDSTGANCTNISGATANSYAEQAADVGDTIDVVVTASNGAGSASQASAPTGVVASGGATSGSTGDSTSSLLHQHRRHTPTSPRGRILCGWPDSTNTGYENAPGYPGSLTTASSTSSTCPTTPQSNHTYSYCLYIGVSIPANTVNVTFYGDEFAHTNPQNPNSGGHSGDNNIVFDYDTFQPQIPASTRCPAGGVTCSESYQYGIYNESGQIQGMTVENSDFWGFGNAIDTEGSTQANPQTFRYNWIHDSSTTGGCGYHNDGIGMLNGGSEQYAVVDHNTIEFTGNTNLIAWQNGTYSHDQNTNNLLSGDNEGYAGGRCTSSCTAPTYIQTTGNTFNTYLAIEGDYPIDNATHYWANTGSTWNQQLLGGPAGSGVGNIGIQRRLLGADHDQ